jgi:hypothetical protein
MVVYAYVVNHVTCLGGADGVVTVTVNLGTPPYTFAWSTIPVQTTRTVSGLTAGSYTVTVTDSDGSTVSSSTTVSDPQTFEKLTGGFPIQQVTAGAVGWGDYDNDGDLDFVLTGLNTSNVPIARIYRNYGNGLFVDMSMTSLTGVRNSAVAWEDYDNDGDIDLLIVGHTGSQYLSRIYRNNGNNTFTAMTGISLTGVAYGSVKWGDYNNDGRSDILLTGYSGTGYVSKIYKNNGANSFSEQSGIILTGVSGSSVGWEDYDKDGDLDILLTGNNGASFFSKIYRNNANNTFTEQTGAGLPGINNGVVAWGDYDNDGFPDILLSGQNTSGNISHIYKNNGNNTFTQVTGAGLIGVNYASADRGDYNSDGLLDILLTGSTGSFTPASKVYRNNGNGTFTEETGLPVTSVMSSAVEWADYDNDGDLDFLLTGSSSGEAVTEIYTNRLCNPNTPPESPVSLSASTSGYDLTLIWSKATDLQTPQDGLTYNVYVGTSPGAIGKKSPMSQLSDGYRRVVQRGNTGQVNSYTLKGLAPGTSWYWGVQALDNCYTGSAFATGVPVVVPFMSLTTVVTDVSCRGENDGAIDLSVNNGAAPYTYLWDNGATTEDISGLISATYQVTVTDQFGYTAVTSATVEEFDMPCDTTVSNQTITSGQTVCYDAVQVLTIAGGGSYFTVENGGNVTLIAGQAIFLLPNTTVYPGGYMHAYITTNGEFCNQAGYVPRVPDPTPEERDDNLTFSPTGDLQFLFSIYPNPTYDDVTLDMNGVSKEETCVVEIFNMTGERIHRESLTGQLKYKLTLADQPVGVYVIHVIAGERTGVAKIIKR